MIKQVTENSNEQNLKLFILYVDHKQTYDSVIIKVIARARIRD